MTGADDRVSVLTPGLRRVLAPNPSPMTLDGTNTWLIGDPGAEPPIVVDPGPDEPAHRARILTACGGRIATVLITHRHLDHTEGAAVLAAAAGCPVRAVDPVWRVGPPADSALADGDRLAVAGWDLEVYATPGHTSDSVSVLLTRRDGGSWLLTGDTVLGRGTTVITHPDGDLGAYLASLDRLAALIEQHAVGRLLPGHGPVRDDPAAVVEGYRRHRLERLAEVRAALAAGDRTPAEVVKRVYADVDHGLWPAAEQSVRAQLDHLGRSDRESGAER